ncbi:amidase [Azohydromonas caseinilytica]|uniref:Amidase n=1 Tax=Azohydromonas caseinilytica TaxID=2728836 RepID=A0A848FC95_9BURK|nr:amidase [Azohydromonas caseinilytica]NML17827.1 amidase [Azohydromonas caseinilytica]
MTAVPPSDSSFAKPDAAPAGADIVELDARALSRAIAERRVSCREVMQAYLAQIERFNPQVNALVSLQPAEELLRQADERDAQLARGERLGWMHGFPQAPKDLAATAGIVTTMGSLTLKSHVPREDAAVVERVRRAGAILIGKSNTPEFGLGSNTYNRVFGITRNAFDPGRSAGGSSGGAAVALALRLLPVADGSDMMGSLRNPAAWNNVVGFRPSLGRVPSVPARDVFYQQLATEGPMARSVADAALLLSVQAGFDPRSPLSLDEDPACFAAPLRREFKGARIGWLGDYGGYLATEPGLLALCTQALHHFESLGCTVEPVLPDYPMERLWRCWLALRGFVVAGLTGEVVANERARALVKPELVWEVEQGLRLTAADLWQATVARSDWYQALRALFERFDFLVLPAAQVFPFDAGLDWPKSIAGRAMDSYHRWMEVVIGPTLAGLPTAAVPAGFDAQGLPMGLQIFGPAQQDLAVLQIAHAYEQASGCTKVRSPLLD